MLQLGINENVILQGVSITEGKALELTLRTGGGEVKKRDIFDELSDTSGEQQSTGGNVSKILVFPPLLPNNTTLKGDLKTDAQKIEEAGNSIKETRNLCKQFLSCFMTSDKIVFRNAMQELGLTDISAILQEATLKAISELIFQDFLVLVTPFLDKTEHPLRLIMVRQSPSKPYLAFRRNFLMDNPIVEPMAIPLASTKLKFTANEIKKGLNTPLLNAPAADAAPAADIADTYEFDN